MSATFEPTLIIVGLILCLFGWTLYWAGVRLLGAVCGAVAATALAVIVILFAGASDHWLWIGCAIAAAIGAVVGIFLITRAHYILFFITGALVGLASAWMLEAAKFEWVESLISKSLGRVLYYILCTLAGGLLVLLAHRLIVIILTSFLGTGLFALGMPPRYAVWLFLPVFLVSLLVQTGILKALGKTVPPAPAKPAGPP